MSADLNDVLRVTAEEVFESLAFLLPMPPEEDETPPVALEAARIRFGGPFEGTLVLAMTEEALPEVARNMLGLDGGLPTPEQQRDAFGELLNVLCGNLLPRIAGEGPVFDLRPAEDPDEAAAAPRDTASARVRLWLDVGQAELTLYLPSDAPVVPAAAGSQASG